MIKVLFVCLGNICRSPMAEAVFRHYVKEAGLADKIAVDSAGTGDWHTGSPPHRGTRNVLTANRISYEGITARQITPSDMKDSHYIIVMDEQNKRDVERLLGYAYGEKRPHIGKLLLPRMRASGMFPIRITRATLKKRMNLLPTGAADC